MTKFSISIEKEQALLKRMEDLNIRDDDLTEKFIKGSGPGGQKINKSSICVYLCHKPTGIEIKCQRSRSQSINRFIARRELCEKLEADLLNKKTKKQQEQEKIRRQKRRRSRRQKEKILEGKKQRATIKNSRKSVREDE